MADVAQLWEVLADSPCPPLIAGSYVVMVELMGPDGVPAGDPLGFFADLESGRHVAAQFAYSQILDGHLLPPWIDGGDLHVAASHCYVYPPSQAREVREREGRDWLASLEDPVEVLLSHYAEFGYFDVVFTRARVQGGPVGPLSLEAALA